LVQQSNIDGANQTTVDGVTVLSVKKNTESKDIFDAICVAGGTRHRSLSADSLTDEKFYDTVKMSLKWNGAKWVTVKE
jgi:hypothetical protein